MQMFKIKILVNFSRFNGRTFQGNTVNIQIPLIWVTRTEKWILPTETSRLLSVLHNDIEYIERM